ncbi:MAG: aminofutalosine synthase MqnE [Campylobacterota bacterium]|nr:aminofutalosine synthase MqnE [Campylobacterota bacterium]
MQFQDRKLLPIFEKIKNDENINKQEALHILHSPFPLEIAFLARFIKLKKSQKKVYYVINKHINYTNICISRCRFCAYSKNAGDEDSYVLKHKEILEDIASAGKNLKEVHIVGGLHPNLPFSYYTDMLKSIKKNFSYVQIKAFTAVEIAHFANLYNMTFEQVLKDLKTAGLDSMPGGGAEIFSERAREILFPNKIGYKQWLEIHRIAHEMNITTNATMLFGHIETEQEIVEHLFKLRDLQAETGGFLCFIPLPFHPWNTIFEGKIKKATALRELKIIALSRIILNNFPHIKAYWIMLSPQVSQIALNFGADDMDGTIHKERITHAAGATSPWGLEEDTIRNLIKKSDFVPVKRDALYNEYR